MYGQDANALFDRSRQWILEEKMLKVGRRQKEVGVRCSKQSQGYYERLRVSLLQQDVCQAGQVCKVRSPKFSL